MGMDEPKWLRIHDRDLRGFVDPKLRSVVTRDLFENLSERIAAAGGRVVKDSRVRWAGILPMEGGEGLFIKQFKVTDRWQQWKYLVRPSRAAQEWTISQFLRDRGIITPNALGMLEKRRHGMLDACVFVTEAIQGARDLLEFCRHGLDDRADADVKEAILRGLAQTTRKIHDSGLFHRDLHAGNFLLADQASLLLYLVDLHQAQRRRKISKAGRLWNIGQLFHSLDFMVDSEAKALFLSAYQGNDEPLGIDMAGCLERIEAMVRRMIVRRRKSRAKRCLKESTLFTINRRDGLRIFRRREFDENTLMDTLRTHGGRIRTETEKLLKNSPKTIVSVVGAEGGSTRRLYVKEYRHGTMRDWTRGVFRRPKAKKAWVAGNLLFNRDMSPQKPVACVESRRFGFVQKAFLVTESWGEDMELDRYLVGRFEKHPGEESRRFIKALGSWVGSLHREGVYHRDLKTCNILVREKDNGWSFSLIDLEDVSHRARIGKKAILRNLVQINCSVPKSFTYSDRLRFLEAYLRAHPVEMDKKTLVQVVMDWSLNRGIVYVSPHGDVIEDFKE